VAEIVLNATVLVLNRSYLPIHVTSARRAFALIYRDVARVVNEEYETFDFESWRRRRGAEGNASIGTPSGAICVPRVILLPSFDRVPKRHVRYSRVSTAATGPTVPNSISTTSSLARSGGVRPGRTSCAAASNATATRVGELPSRRDCASSGSPQNHAGHR
jgi:hypothetical protein